MDALKFGRTSDEEDPMEKYPFVIRCEKKTASYSEEEQFLTMLDGAIQLGLQVSVSIAVSALPVIEKINEIFIRRGIHARVLAERSDEAVDYVASATAGGLAGGALGGAVGWLTLVVTRAPVIPYIGVPVAVLAGLGALAGLIATRKGHSITAHLKEERLQIELDPTPPPLAA